MVMGRNCFGQVVEVASALSFLSASSLSIETIRKCETRAFVFLTEDELDMLTCDTYNRYMQLAYNWLIRDCHTGPIWLSALAHEYVHGDN